MKGLRELAQEHDLKMISPIDLDQTAMSAYLDELNMITVIDHENRLERLHFELTRNDKVLSLKHIKQTRIDGDTYYRLYLDKEIELGVDHLITDQFNRSIPLKIGAVVRTALFDQKYSAPEEELGTFYTEDYTDFRLWAPTATKVYLELFHQDGGMKLVPMKRGERGIWSSRVLGDLHNQAYMYKICVNQAWNEAVDPYTKAVTINGEKGIIIDLKRTNPDNWDSHQKPEPLKQANDAIIYELHVRDFSIANSSGIQNKGKYSAFLEKGTTSPNGFSTGIDYLAELGVTHIQLLPLQDFGSVDERAEVPSYNWGYDPVHFNVPEGSYSNEPEDPVARIKELKQLIMALHAKNLSVILDVVYNHFYKYELSSFEKIVPGYFFRVDHAGNPSNGSGVGNDTASERIMYRKFIKDSVQYWAKEYQLEGFRFDLMGLHDIQTMNEVRSVLNNMDSSILLIGEGWNLKTFLPENERAIIRNASHMEGISFFNDRFRDTIKGSTFSPNALGFIQGNLSSKNTVSQTLIGNVQDMFQWPQQSVNYVECHDNHTLWDKLEASLPKTNEDELLQRHKLATTIVLMSQGIPFLHAGQEFCRTKYGNENSYNAPDAINQLDWLRREKFDGYITFIKKLIHLRKTCHLFRLHTKKEIEQFVSLIQTDGLAGFQIENERKTESWKRLLFLMNHTTQSRHYKLKDHQKWKLIQKGFEVDMNGMEFLTDSVEIPALDTVIIIY